MNLRNTRISTRLFLGFGTMTALIALVGAVALANVRQIGEQFDSVQDDRYPKVVAVYGIKAEVEDVALAMRNVFIMSEPADVQKQWDEVASSDQKISQGLSGLAQAIKADQGGAQLAEVQAARASYRALRDRVIAMVKAGNAEEARPILLNDLMPLQAAYMGKLDQLIRWQDESMKESGQEVDRLGAAALVWVGSLVAASIFLGFVLAVWIVRNTTGPLHRAVQAAARVAEGNLAFPIADEGRNEAGALLDALRTMKDRLATIVQGVRDNAEGVATASSQISQGNTDLSSRTEEQASSLQQTAASMEALASTVQQNASNADQANQLAISASAVAVEGGQVVAQVVHTMRDIQESSQRIADIIQVIDGIAFQTNILALNAAVEAARAGEQGRGFAVVAGEVRALAQRSAEAAKQVKQLIGTSVERVERGTGLVEKAGATMEEVVASIRKVAEIVGEISTASQEQNQGVGQVNDAVSQMDKVTQQNASLVEQSAAAAESLMEQAQRLLADVSVFKIGNAAPAAI